MKDIYSLKDKIKLILHKDYNEDLISDSFIEYSLDRAKNAINLKRQFKETEESQIEDKFIPLLLELAIIYISKQGAEGESIHSELGVNRHYEDIERKLSSVIPLVSLK